MNHVTRRRAPRAVRRRLPQVLGRRALPLAAAGTAVLVVTGGGVAYATTTVFGHHRVGSTYGTGLQISSDQVLKPLGDRLVTDNGKIMGSAVSPDGRFLAAASTDKSIVLQIFDLKSYELVWTVGTGAAANAKIADGSVGQEAPTFSPDGKFVWLAQTDGLTRFPVNADGTLGAGTVVPLPQVNGQSALPGGAAYSADGGTLYVALNGQNSVAALNPSTGKVQRTWAVGTAPRQVALVGGTLYVSDEGGRAPRPGETAINSYGTAVPADPYLGTSTTGTLSVIDTAHPGAAVGSIDVGLHPTALHVSGGALFVANTGDDSVSVVDTRKGRVVQTISTKPWASADVGYQPTAIATTKDGHLLITLARANAVAVYTYAGRPQEPVGYLGLLPTDYYPADVAAVGNQVVVTNTRGIDARGPELTFKEGTGTTPATGHGTHSTTASLTRFRLPTTAQIAKDTATVFAQNGWGKDDVAQAKGRTPAAVPVPARVGDPSTIKHVFLLVKENRTYDQVYGDDPRGDGDPSLAQFGAKVTPNQHALAKQFGLYDNLYDVGTNSAEGHNWLMQGDNPEYTESSAGEYVRSYDTEDDVLGHQRSGFLWTSVQSAGKTARNFGEFTQFETKPATATWQSYYCAATGVDQGGDPATLFDPSIRQDSESPIPSLNAITDHAYPKFDTDIPDLYRYQVWKQDFEKNGPAALNTFWLSSDHTGGTPDPRAQVADNDLAVGKIVDEISHSPYWKDSAIFVVEDDSQAGADHVDGHRAPVQIISPWAQHGKVDSTYYSQLTVVRTIQQILGAQPLNQKLAAATPMASAFTSKPDLTPFTAVPNQVPLTEGVATAPACGEDTLGLTGARAAQLKAQVQQETAVPASQQAVADQWAAWAKSQHFTGAGAAPDQANPEQMNRYTWYRTHGWTVPYPGDSVIYVPGKVPGAYVASAETD
ncbi:bifunctional YncE family protein/alkaline phosphatase family protein [Kineococcus rhizosphaerae]|uniref:YVTN family beta-propeller protein n=1 Tax=Kineococcus rhizosphaerae TaxID=559628 RepID=A0A2T0R0G4_9ACTN|nr:alkaline phosphatase family protein [Kineococcus rhizosphaerae]PRY12825.1 YVTN family beta-propeller protein [Kineococcus rhizosphaerae]